MKVAIVGNCQARPVGRYLKLMCPQIELLPVTIVHLSNSESKKEECSRLEEADIIFGQQIQDGYPADHLTTSVLRERFGNKVFAWPNLFFNGSCADTVYITTKSNQRLHGPLDVYHNRHIFECWQSRIPLEEVRDAIHEMYSKQREFLIQNVDQSLAELTSRDACCDTDIVSFVKNHWKNRRLFYTFNHPSNELLTALSRRLAEIANLSIEIELQACFEAEPLNKIIPPTLNEAVDIFEIKYDSADSAMGVHCHISGNELSTEGRRLYSFSELTDRFYQSYAAQNVGEEAVRFTPGYVG